MVISDILCFNHKVIYKITLDTKDKKQFARKKFPLYFKSKYMENKNYTGIL